MAKVCSKCGAEKDIEGFDISHTCNQMLGMAHDDAVTLVRAIKYLESFEGNK